MRKAAPDVPRGGQDHWRGRMNNHGRCNTGVGAGLRRVGYSVSWWCLGLLGFADHSPGQGRAGFRGLWGPDLV